MPKPSKLTRPSPHPIFLEKSGTLARAFGGGRLAKKLEALGYPPDLSQQAAAAAKNDGRLASELAFHSFFGHKDAEEPESCPVCKRQDEAQFQAEVAGMTSPHMS